MDFLFNALPMYQRLGAPALKADLIYTLRICDHLGNPQLKFKSIHVAGTNGKGSTSHALASILQESGYKVGLYTSPHLKSFTERIKINGKEIAEQKIVSFVSQNKPFLEELQPSFFEMTVGLAFDHFAEEMVDYAIIEVGLGGRLDSTNVIFPELSVITNIGLDHVQFLGNNLEKIAGEKAGIIKKGVPVVISETQKETKPVFELIARQQDAPIFFSDQLIQVKPLGSGKYEVLDGNEKHIYQLDLMGSYQQKNLAGILQAIKVLRNQGLEIGDGALQAGLGRVTANTGLKGRWQKLGENPLVFCDTGHNTEALRYIIEQIKSYPYKNLIMVLGVSKDKELETVLPLFPQNAYFIFCQAKIPRAMAADELYSKAKEYGLEGEVVPDVNLALEKALAKASKDDFVFIGGSTFVVAEIQNL